MNEDKSFKICPECGNEIPIEDETCYYCEYNFEEVICSVCGKRNPLNEEFCFNCGSKLNKEYKPKEFLIDEAHEKHPLRKKAAILTAIALGLALLTVLVLFSWNSIKNNSINNQSKDLSESTDINTDYEVIEREYFTVKKPVDWSYSERSSWNLSITDSIMFINKFNEKINITVEQLDIFSDLSLQDYYDSALQNIREAMPDLKIINEKKAESYYEIRYEGTYENSFFESIHRFYLNNGYGYSVSYMAEKSNFGKSLKIVNTIFDSFKIIDNSIPVQEEPSVTNEENGEFI